MTAVDFEGTSFTRAPHAEATETAERTPRLTLEYAMISLGSALLLLAVVLGLTGH